MRKWKWKLKFYPRNRKLKIRKNGNLELGHRKKKDSILEATKQKLEIGNWKTEIRNLKKNSYNL